MKTFIILAGLTLTLASTAAVQDQLVLSCKNQRAELKVFKTIAPSLFQGYYNNGSKIPTILNCTPTQKQTGSMKKIMTCVEARSGDGKLLVDIESGGYTGTAIANVSIEQIFSQKPQYLGSLNCIK